MDATNLVAWLRFDESTTADKCGNEWTTSGSPTIENGELKLNGSSYLRNDRISAAIGDDIWTIHWYATCTGTLTEHFFFGTYNANYGTSGTGKNKWVSVCYLKGNPRLSLYSNDIEAGVSLTHGQRYHYALSYDGTNLRLFIDGQLKITKTANIKLGGAFRIGADPCRSDAYQYFIGTIDEFQILKGIAWTENFTPPTATEYEKLELILNSTIEFTADVERVIKNDAYIKRIAPLLKVWLPFDESTTTDLCGGTWAATGSPTISETNAITGKALQLNGSSYLSQSGGITLGGQDFTICGWFNTGSTGNWSRIFSLHNDANSNTAINLMRREKGNTFACQYAVGTTAYFSATLNVRHHFELDYSHAESTVRVFIDGTLTATSSGTIPKTTFANLFIGRGNFTADDNLTGSVDEFQIYDGVALHTANFTPPTAAFYEELALILGSTVEFTVDVERRISNVVEFTADVERKVINAWRYVNLGTADKLTVTGTTLENLSATKSVTGTAFYQTARAKCFDLPTTDEVWLKFDVYFDGSNRWRAYNGGANGTKGITAQTDGELDIWVNGNRQNVFSGAALKNQLQTVILHMISGASDGVVEVWSNGTKLGTYTGDVNHGEDFADIYLQSDGAGTFFSNVIISNREIGLNDGYISFTADVQRKLSNIVEFTADVQRGIMEVINVPFIFGDHFNHCCSVEYDAPTTSIGRPLKIKLPNKSKAYVHATALNGGAFKVFSDTDAVGTVTGDVYAALDECESVFVQKVVAPQSILYMFLNSLRYRGGSALDSAIENCTYGVFPSKDELVNSFLNDLDNSENNLDFLSRCCGVDLSNDDTGAVIGSDAGGGYPKTAKSIVTEPVPVEDWIVPEKGSSKTIAGLTVYFPTSGYKGTLTDAENHILAGLNSVWIEQALLLIQRSCNIDFRTNQTNIVHDISVKFVDENNDALAYVSITTKDGSTTSLELRVNMRRYSGINMTSEDGAAGSNTYLDRVLAHEMTHAVMAARIKNYTELPRFLSEGIAEFIHGIDDERKSDIQYLTQTAQRNTLQSIFSTGGDSGDINIYSAGYLFFRYMIKQTLEKGTFPLERYSSTGHIRLFISDGAVDYFGNALTDNTRAIFSADVLRELIKTTSFTADVAIFDMIRVEFTADVMRSIIGKVKLFARDNSAYFEENPSSSELTPVVIPSQSLTDIGRSPAAPNNTNDLQSVEISIAEQQITDNVTFVGNVPFDIMYPVRGQYLDYLIDMRVERVQKHGILYSCDCCSDIDALLYTQIAYTVPQNESWHRLDDEFYQKTKTSADEWQQIRQQMGTKASVHVKKIAATLGLSYVMQFDDFNSTVFMSESGGVTYADLMREIFDWSVRVPTQMINYFIRNGVLYIVQRGHEARLIDLSETKHTIPTVTHDLVRMTWGASPWSKTETRERKEYTAPTYTSPIYTPPEWGQNQWPVSSEDIRNMGVTSSNSYSDGSSSGGSSSGGNSSSSSSGDDDSSSGSSSSGSYGKEGETVTIEGDLKTVTKFEYTADGQISYTETTVYKKGDTQSRSTVSYEYITLKDGRKFLTKETKKEYGLKYNSTTGINELELIDTIVTEHTPVLQGQEHVVAVNEDGDIVGEVVGQHTGDERVTPYSEMQYQYLGPIKPASLATFVNGVADKWGFLSHTAATIAQLQQSGEMNEETVNAFEDLFPDFKPGEWSEGGWSDDGGWSTFTEQCTINGISLVDTSFPISQLASWKKLVALTNTMKWLNRKTQETVTMTIYEYPHLIDFNDRIIFEGNVYFLVSNTATTTERIFNEQRVTFVRWY